jgi:glucose dehydrogenase
LWSDELGTTRGVEATPVVAEGVVYFTGPTGGNLVFQGTAEARFGAYDASTGNLLWETPTGTAVIAAPVTYMVEMISPGAAAANPIAAFRLRKLRRLAAEELANESNPVARFRHVIAHRL